MDSSLSPADQIVRHGIVAADLRRFGNLVGYPRLPADHPVRTWLANGRVRMQGKWATYLACREYCKTLGNVSRRTLSAGKNWCTESILYTWTLAAPVKAGFSMVKYAKAKGLKFVRWSRDRGWSFGVWVVEKGAWQWSTRFGEAALKSAGTVVGDSYSAAKKVGAWAVTTTLSKSLELGTAAGSCATGLGAGLANSIQRTGVRAIQSSLETVFFSPIRLVHRQLPEGILSRLSEIVNGMPARDLTLAEQLSSLHRNGLRWHVCGATAGLTDDVKLGTHGHCEDCTANADVDMVAYLRKHAMFQARNVGLIRKLHQRAIAFAQLKNMSDHCFWRVAPSSIILAYMVSDREEYALNGAFTKSEWELATRRFGAGARVGGVWSLWDVATRKVSFLAWATQRARSTLEMV